MQKDAESMAASHFFHNAHDEHVLIDCKIGFSKDWSKLKLVRCNFVVTGFHRYAQTMSLNLKIGHESLDTRRNLSEIVVIQLLILGRSMSHQSASTGYEIRTSSIKPVIYKKI